MAELNDDLNMLIDVRNDMKSSLINKGLNPSDDIRTYANEIINISGGSGSSNKLVDGMKLAESTFINYPNYDLSDVTNMYHMFYNCPNLTTILNINTSNAINMYGMFENCRALTTISEFNASQVTIMNNMFAYCNNLSNASIQNIINTCLNAVNVEYKDLRPHETFSPFYNTNINYTRYENRLTELYDAGWMY